MSSKTTRATAHLAVRSTVWVTLGSYLTQLIAFGATLVLTRQLGPQIFGFLSIGTFWSSLLALNPKFSLNYAAIQRTTTDGELLGTYWELEVLLAIASLVTGIIAAILLPLAGYAGSVSLVVIVLMSLSSLSVLISPMNLMLEKELRLGKLTAIGIIATMTAYLVSVGLAFAGAGLWSLLAQNIISTYPAHRRCWVCQTTTAYFSVPLTVTRPMAQHLVTGPPIGLSGLVTMLAGNYDNFLIGTFVSATMLGFYDRAWRLSQWPNTLLTAALVRVAFLTFAKVKGDTLRLTHAVRLVLWTITSLGIPMALMLFFGGPDIIQILYGSAWSQSAYFLRFLAIYSIFSPFIAAANSLIAALGHRRVLFLLAIAQAVTLILVGTPMTLWQGYKGTVLSVGVSVAVGFGLSCFYIFRHVPLSITASFGTPLLAGIAAASLTVAASHLPHVATLPPIARLVVIAITAPGTYVGITFALERAETLQRLRYLVRTFKTGNAEEA
jgi:PST family polysaccharide transporter